MIIVDDTGPLTLIEDLGRPGYSALGVSPSGAADRSGLRLANRLVGNPEDAAALEITLGGLRIHTDRPLWCAVAGAGTTVMINDRPERSHRAVHLAAGDRLAVLPPPSGLRNYLAVRGGIDVPPVLGSRSTDLLSDLGPAPLRPGDRLPVCRPDRPDRPARPDRPDRPERAHQPLPDTDLVPPPPAPTLPLLVDLQPGPRSDWFTDQAHASLTKQIWTVSADSDRTAVRLTGDPLERAVDDELPSEGLIRGAVQVPPSGLPLIFGSNHPVTGGYPVIAVVGDDDCDRLAQLRPGDTVRFRRRGNL